MSKRLNFSQSFKASSTTKQPLRDENMLGTCTKHTFSTSKKRTFLKQLSHNFFLNVLLISVVFCAYWLFAVRLQNFSVFAQLLPNSYKQLHLLIAFFHKFSLSKSFFTVLKLRFQFCCIMKHQTQQGSGLICFVIRFVFTYFLNFRNKSVFLIL